MNALQITNLKNQLTHKSAMNPGTIYMAMVKGCQAVIVDAHDIERGRHFIKEGFHIESRMLNGKEI